LRDGERTTVAASGGTRKMGDAGSGGQGAGLLCMHGQAEPCAACSNFDELVICCQAHQLFGSSSVSNSAGK